MSCVRAAPTAAPATRPAMPSTVMAVGSTLVGEHCGTRWRYAWLAELQPHPTGAHLASTTLCLRSAVPAPEAHVPVNASRTPSCDVLCKSQSHIRLPLHTFTLQPSML